MQYILLIISIAITVIVSHYYFRRGQKKNIEIYFHYLTSVFGGIDKSVKDNLNISYQKKYVKDLIQLQFIVSNQGEVSLKNAIKPLTFELPSSVNVLDVKIPYVEPSGREINYSIIKLKNRKTNIVFQFPVLNKKEGFIVKILLTGELNPKETKFTITDDGLPPEIKPFGWGVSHFGLSYPVNWIALFLYFVFIGLGGVVIFLSINYTKLHPSAIPFLSNKFQFSTDTLVIVSSFFLGLFVSIISFIMTVSQDGRPLHNPDSRMNIPEHLRKPEWISRDPFGRIPESHLKNDKNAT
jgi:hypothetical protein